MDAQKCLVAADGPRASSPLDDSAFSNRRVMSALALSLTCALWKTATQYEHAAVSLELTSQNTNIYNGFQMCTQETLE